MVRGTGVLIPGSPSFKALKKTLDKRSGMCYTVYTLTKGGLMATDKKGSVIFEGDISEVALIAKRAEGYGVKRERVALLMDIQAVQGSSTPMNLVTLMSSSKADFLHDITGIIAHLDRQTGELMDCFLPRASR
jgi:hypothetical protein